MRLVNNSARLYIVGGVKLVPGVPVDVNNVDVYPDVFELIASGTFSEVKKDAPKPAKVKADTAVKIEAEEKPDKPAKQTKKKK